LGNGQLLLGPRATLLLSSSLRWAERLSRLEGGARPTTDFARLRHLVEQAAAEVTASGTGSADLPLAGEVSRSDHPSRFGHVEPIGTAVAASLLSVSDRAVRDRCRRGEYATAVLVGKAWLIERAEVEAAALGRRDKDEDEACRNKRRLSWRNSARR
jgi:hypothetical protein